MIKQITTFLNQPYDKEGYYVKEFSNNLFFGKDKDNNIICAKRNFSKELSFSMTTEAIELFQNYHFTLKIDSTETGDNYDMIVLKNTFADTKSTFVNLCLNFYNEDSDRSITELTNDLIEMYKVNSLKDSTFEQGLWGELFSILYIKNNFDIDISKYWHNDNFNKYDFSLNGNTKLEVKSTSKELREHRFSHEQIYTNYDVIISSINVRKDDSGFTVFDLYNQVQELFDSSYDLLIKIEKELKKLDKSDLDRYDFEYSVQNIKFYLNKNTPHFDKPEPKGIHSTQYTVVFENVNELNTDKLTELLTIIN